MGRALLMTMIVLGGVELGARYLVPGDHREASRTYQPIFVSGHYFHFLKTRQKLAEESWEGPGRSGYECRNGVFVYDSTQRLNSAASRFNWVFQNEFSRYTAEEIDELSGRTEGGTRIFVIGGSVALGTHASSSDTTWDARLEAKLRDRYDDDRIYVFNAAVGGFVSTQERLVLELAVLPRNPDIVIVLNGFNDTFLPLTIAVRPGDPYQTGIRYTSYYCPSFLVPLARFSTTASMIHQSMTERIITRRVQEILDDPEVLDITVANEATIYCDNMEAILSGCERRGCDAVVFLQPWRRRGKLNWNPAVYDAGEHVYGRISEHFQTSPNGPRFHDLTTLFADVDGDSVFSDNCHLLDPGQEILADAIFTHVVDLVGRVRDRTRP